MAAPAADKELCKSGGFASYVDPTTDLPFADQGRCVALVNGGGLLVAVEQEPPVPVAPTAKVTVAAFANGVFDVAVEAQGQPNTTYALDLQSGAVQETRSVTTSAEGLAYTTVGVAPETLLEVRHNGVVIGSVITPAAPVEEPPVEEGLRASVAATPARPGYFTFSAAGLSPNGGMRLLLTFPGGQIVSQPGVADANGNWTSNPTSLSCSAIPTYTVQDYTTGTATPVAPALTPTDC
jgi:hypothetical protein